jgi:hypothetical protein
LSVSTYEQGSLGSSKLFHPELVPEYWYADILSTLDLFLRAAIRSGCKVNCIKVKANTLSRFGNNGDDDLFDVMDSLTTLSLEVNVVEGDGTTDPTEAIAVVRKLLSWKISLKALDICSDTFCHVLEDGCLSVVLAPF